MSTNLIGLGLDIFKSLPANTPVWRHNGKVITKKQALNKVKQVKKQLVATIGR